VPRDTTEASAGELTPVAKEVLRTAAAIGMSMTTACGRDDILAGMLPSMRNHLQDAIIDLMNRRPPLLARGPVGPNYFFTRDGAKTALQVVRPAPDRSDEADDYPRYPGPQRLHRGENNRRMGEYAAAVGARLVIDDGRRCNLCSEADSHFVLKGGKFLCQVCFAKGKRFG
jgi:hypothetical protein